MMSNGLIVVVGAVVLLVVISGCIGQAPTYLAQTFVLNRTVDQFAANFTLENVSAITAAQLVVFGPVVGGGSSYYVDLALNDALLNPGTIASGALGENYVSFNADKTVLREINEFRLVAWFPLHVDRIEIWVARQQ